MRRNRNDIETLSVDSYNALDRLVAEKVMGWRVMDWDETVPKKGEILIYEMFEPKECNGWALYQVDSIGLRGTSWNPSRSMASAWVVAEKMYPNHEFTLERGWLKHPIRAWHCHMGFCDATADTPTLAICVASLLAVGIAVTPAASMGVTFKYWVLGDAITI
jgi:hypothetical protein